MEDIFVREITAYRIGGEIRLPKTISCILCGRDMRCLKTRTVPTYRCAECDATTTLELTTEQQAQVKS